MLGREPFLSRWPVMAGGDATAREEFGVRAWSVVAPSERKVSMSEYLDIGGIRTWYDERGKGEPLVLLHPGGAGVDARAWSLAPIRRA